MSRKIVEVRRISFRGFNAWHIHVHGIGYACVSDTAPYTWSNSPISYAIKKLLLASGIVAENVTLKFVQ